MGVVGLGYVGLPLAVELARAGFQVLGIDTNRDRVESVNRGETHVLDVPSEVIAPLIRERQLSATASFDAVSELDVIFICVPTPHDAAKAPDLSYIQAASHEIGKRLRAGQLIVL